MNNTQKIALKDLVYDKSIHGRFNLNNDAIERYAERYANGEAKTIKIQANTNKIIDGVHRYHAAIKAGIKELYAKTYDVPDSDLRALVHKFNRDHGIPYSIPERNNRIIRLCLEDGKTDLQIASIIGLSERRVGQILSTEIASDSDKEIADKRRKLSPENIIAISKLLIAGEIQEKVSDKFNVAQNTISKLWAKKRDEIKSIYEDGKLKKEMAEEFGLTPEEIDKVLQQYGDPINFEPTYTSFWPAFGIDNKYGQKHKGHIPAKLIQNILFFYSNPGDIILDPFAGGGTVQDVCNDMVNRVCYSYNLNPVSPKIKFHNIREGAPSCEKEPNFIFLDPPYGPQKKDEYSHSKDDLANLPVNEFLDEMEKIFGY